MLRSQQRVNIVIALLGVASAIFFFCMAMFMDIARAPGILVIIATGLYAFLHVRASGDLPRFFFRVGALVVIALVGGALTSTRDHCKTYGLYSRTDASSAESY